MVPCQEETGFLLTEGQPKCVHCISLLHMDMYFCQQLMMIHTLLSQFLIAVMLLTSPEAVLHMLA